MKEENKVVIILGYLITILLLFGFGFEAFRLGNSIFSNPNPEHIDGILTSFTSRLVMFLAMVIIIVTYLLGLVFASKINKKSLDLKYFNYQNILWYQPKYFRIRFYENKLLSRSMAILFTSILFALMTALLGWYISNKDVDVIRKYHNNNGAVIVADSLKSIAQTVADSTEKEMYVEKISENLIFNVGLPFALIISLLSMITYLNTEVIKKKNEVELYSLNEIYEVLIDKLIRLTPVFERCRKGAQNEKNQRFYYVIDHSLSLGHKSAGIDSTQFKIFNTILRRFYCGDHTTIKAITLNEDALLDNYKAIFYSEGTRNSDPDLANDVNDSKYTYDQLINYFAMIPAERREDCKLNVESDYKFDKEMDSSEIKRYAKISVEDFESDKSSRILKVSEIGVTRMIITNSFVLTFISYETATKSGKKNRPIAYLTEEYLAIEKSKAAFIQNFIRICKLSADKLGTTSTTQSP